MADFEVPEEPDMPAPVPPQEKRMGFLLVAFMIGLLIGLAPVLFFLDGRTKKVQAEAVKAGHAVYKVIDEFGHTQFEWLPVPGHPASQK